MVSDILLIAIPFRLLWRLNIDKGSRRLILTIFATSILTTLTGIVYAYFMLTCAVLPVQGLTLNLEVWVQFPCLENSYKLQRLFQVVVSLLVCNLLVVVTYLDRVFRRDGSEDVVEPHVSKHHAPCNVASRAGPLMTDDFNVAHEYSFDPEGVR